MPLVRRVPKRGFHNRFGLTVAVVNLGDLEERFQAGEEVNAETLKAKNLAQGTLRRAQGPWRRRADQEPEDLRPPLQPHGAEKIQQAGGEVVVLPGKKPVVKNKQKSVPTASDSKKDRAMWEKIRVVFTIPELRQKILLDALCCWPSIGVG